MKKYINRNFFWADLFVEQLHIAGICNVCISPGSRNTPLTMAFAANKNFKKHIHIDERSSGFFALGLAKSTQKPVAILTTSGTAVAELYPAVIEAYNQRIPLVICTADRPEYLRNTGANQTINQENFFSNHIRFFADFGLPNLNKGDLKKLINNTLRGIHISKSVDRGPVHFNFPFKKPLEPNSFSDEIKFKLSDFIIEKTIESKINNSSKNIIKLKKYLQNSSKPIIHCGWDNYSNEFNKALIDFSLKNNIPVFTDGATNLRFYTGNNSLNLVNHSAFINELKSEPDLIIQFGNPPTSQSILRYFEQTKATRILINKYGDVKDPSRNKGILFKLDPDKFFSEIRKINSHSKIWKKWSDYITSIDQQVEVQKVTLANAKFGIEPKITNEILNIIPRNSNVFVSNSMPIRDFDLFASKIENNISIYTNRGASGIDGIISTASGIAAESKYPTYLVIGDLAFYHNISALSYLYNNRIPLRIILINNNGGGIFKLLPIADNNKYFEEYFNTAHNVDFKKVVKSFGGNFYSPKNWKKFTQNLEVLVKDENFSVIELKTDSKASADFRKKYIRQTERAAQKFNEYQTS